MANRIWIDISNGKRMGVDVEEESEVPFYNKAIETFTIATDPTKRIRIPMNKVVLVEMGVEVGEITGFTNILGH